MPDAIRKANGPPISSRARSEVSARSRWASDSPTTSTAGAPPDWIGRATRRRAPPPGRRRRCEQPQVHALALALDDDVAAACSGELGRAEQGPRPGARRGLGDL